MIPAGCRDPGIELELGIRHVGNLRLEVAHARRRGHRDDPLVILLHGFPDVWQGWRLQIPALVHAGFQVLAPNQRGYGDSDKPAGVDAYRLDRLSRDVLDLADAVGHRRFALVGHDWGGIVAWWTAACHPDRVERVVVLNAPHPDAIGPALQRDLEQWRRSAYVALFQLPRLPEALLAASGFRRLIAALQRSGLPDEALAVERDTLLQAWTKPGALTAMLNWYRALRHRPGRGVPQRVSQPSLLIWGLCDPAEGRLFADLSLELCDQAQVLWLPEARHWVQREAPDAVNASIVDFLRASPSLDAEPASHHGGTGRAAAP